MKERTLSSWIILAMTLILLGGMIVTNAGGSLKTPPEVTTYYASVAESIDAIPHHFGAWIGQDIPPQPAAVELLRPNKLLQRRYVNTENNAWFELLIVHCGDVRDMLGHFPPVCYPAHGWDLDGRKTVGVQVGQFEADAVFYTFRREQDFTTNTKTVLSLFILPSPEGPILEGAYAPVERAGRYRDRSRLGAAQVQVITPDGLSEESRTRIRTVALSLISELAADIGRMPL
jgi:hypothetical protein